MKTVRSILAAVFGALGASYAVIGGGMLLKAATAAGKLSAIFTLPEEQKVLAVNGTIFALLSVGFLLSALILVLLERRARHIREELRAYGTRLTGTVAEVYRDYSLKVNRRSPMIAKVVCQLPSGEKILRSQPLWHAQPVPGQQVTVCFDPMDERRYLVDIEDLPH